MSHLHLTSLVISLILLIFFVFQQSKGNYSKKLHMVLRVSYILVFATGCMLLFAAYTIPFSYYLKGIIGFLMIGLFEMVISQKQKGKSTDLLWIAFSIVFVILFILGFTLPQGFDLIK